MSRSSNTPTIFIIISLIVVLEASMIVMAQPFFAEVHEFMSNEDDRSAMRNTIDTCVKPDGFCDLGNRDCCPSSACRCNKWGYNCRCEVDGKVLMPLSYDKTYQGSMYNNPPEPSCIRRGGACDHRPTDCCFSSSCRCNLWGSNCRCQRMGLFQKWG